LLIEAGADLIYTMGMQLDRIKKLTKQYIPCVSHLGLMLYYCSWTGGFRALGGTTEEAKAFFMTARELDDASIIAAEVECVPHQLAAY